MKNIPGHLMLHNDIICLYCMFDEMTFSAPHHTQILCLPYGLGDSLWAIFWFGLGHITHKTQYWPSRICMDLCIPQVCHKICRGTNSIRTWRIKMLSVGLMKDVALQVQGAKVKVWKGQVISSAEVLILLTSLLDL